MLTYCGFGTVQPTERTIDNGTHSKKSGKGDGFTQKEGAEEINDLRSATNGDDDEYGKLHKTHRDTNGAAQNDDR